MWAVKILPGVKKTVRSTIPTMMLSKVGSRFSNLGSTEPSSDAWGQGCVAPESVVHIGIFVCAVKASLASLSR
jgi:hypothetical protein